MSFGLQGFEDEGLWLRNRFWSSWVDPDDPGELRTPVAMEGEASPDTVDGSGNPVPWVRFTVQSVNATQSELGIDGAHRYSGVVVIEIFVPPLRGTRAAAKLADAAVGIFRNARGPRLRFGSPNALPTQQIGIQEQDQQAGAGKWLKRDVLCPFERDTVFK
jgi:hypothetical protein